MLGAVPMVHVQIQVANRDAAAAARRVASMGLLHLVDIGHGQGAAELCPPGTHELLAAFRDLAQRTARVAERIQLALPEVSGPIDRNGMLPFADEHSALEALLAPIERRVAGAWERLSGARERGGRLDAERDRLALLGRAKVDAARLAAMRFATTRLAIGRAEEFDRLAGALAPAPFAVIPLESTGERFLAAAVVPAALGPHVDAALRLSAVEPVPLPADGADPGRLRDAVRDAATEADGAATLLDRERIDNGQALGAIARRAEVAVLLLQAQTCFASAGRFVVISGWIPAADSAALAQAVADATGGRAVVAIEQPDDLPHALAGSLRIPILYRNPLFLRPFQTLVQLYGVPSYREVQPVALFAISFLLMFGLMFGDAGHGLVLFSAGYCLFRYLPRYLDYGILLMEGGAASAVFGVLYGSFFGIEGLLPVLWIEPIRNLPQFMAIAAAFGAVVVTLGIALNIVNCWRAGERVTAVFGRRGLVGAFLYWIVLALAARLIVPRGGFLPTSALALMIGISALLLLLRRPIVRRLGGGRAAPPGPIWLAALEGSVELVDTIFTYFANTISFVRVAAFAAVHAGVFIAMFALADTLARTTIGTPLSVAALVVGNAVMILLEGLTVSVQVLRLEYYEFFDKFFRGGGEPYRPLMLRSGAGKDTP